MTHLVYKQLENFPRHQDIFDASGVMVTDWHVWFSKLIESVPKMTRYVFTLDPANIPAFSTTLESVTLSGLSVQDIVLVNKPAYISGIIIDAVCSVDDRLDITFANITAGAINPGSSSSYSCYAFRI